MKEYKRLKDPIYSYISIPVRYMNDIIDTCCFQRLRRVIQTSYAPLYSSAVHNRFVHSMGVYHLGEIVSNQLVYEINHKFPDYKTDKFQRVFLLACLLHDIGHAPFSHTGEKFYLEDGEKYTLLHEQMSKYVNDKSFEADIPSDQSGAAAPHEIMSAIVGLKEYGRFLEDPEERAFFARCITGYKYKENSDENNLKNCFISLLNSKTIDVDKMDYLIRDAYITGFDTVDIDYERLLTAITVIRDEQGFQLAYHKSAISVIENVIYAHDSERKWIQSHPIVLYESYILQHVIDHLCQEMKQEGRNLFSLASLGSQGQCFDNHIKIKLLCDDDIIYLMKNVYPNEIGEEYFERRKRRHPIWKSEAEYKAFFIEQIGAGRTLTDFENAMEETAKYLLKSTDSWVIDEHLIEKIQAELNCLDSQKLDDMSKNAQRKSKTAILKVMRCLQSFAQQYKLECNFVILKADQFNSGFGKPDFSKTNIVFSSKQEDFPAKVSVVTSLEAKESEREKFFYLFYKRPVDGEKELDNYELCKSLMRAFI